MRRSARWAWTRSSTAVSMPSPNSLRISAMWASSSGLGCAVRLIRGQARELVAVEPEHLARRAEVDLHRVRVRPVAGLALGRLVLVDPEADDGHGRLAHRAVADAGGGGLAALPQLGELVLLGHDVGLRRRHREAVTGRADPGVEIALVGTSEGGAAERADGCVVAHALTIGARQPISSG